MLEPTGLEERPQTRAIPSNRPDSARWDIFRGEVDDRLLTALAGAADRYALSIAVLSSGHPPNVWAS
jgi:hypothetical protein